MTRIALAFALLLSSCNIPGSSDMPDLNDEASVRAAILKLDPIAPGGPPDDRGPLGAGQLRSDRAVFIRWLHNYAALEPVRQMGIDYEPAPLPTSLAAAVREQRAREESEGKLEAERQARLREDDRAERARQDKQRRDSEATQAAEKQAADERSARHAEALAACYAPYNPVKAAYEADTTVETGAALNVAEARLTECLQRCCQAYKAGLYPSGSEIDSGLIVPYPFFVRSPLDPHRVCYVHPVWASSRHRRTRFWLV